MENEENKEQDESEIENVEDIEVHNLIQAAVEMIVCPFFIIFFGGGGILAILQKDSDMVTKIVGGIFIIYGIALVYKVFCL